MYRKTVSIQCCIHHVQLNLYHVIISLSNYIKRKLCDQLTEKALASMVSKLVKNNPDEDLKEKKQRKKKENIR